jgi:hypothetical protein
MCARGTEATKRHALRDVSSASPLLACITLHRVSYAWKNSLVLLEEMQALHGAKAPCRFPPAMFEGALQHIRHVANYQACGLNSPLALAGAGAGIARKFAREGFKVALVSRKQETLAPIAQEITESGGQALSVPADTGKPPARQHLSVNSTLHEKTGALNSP